MTPLPDDKCIYCGSLGGTLGNSHSRDCPRLLAISIEIEHMGSEELIAHWKKDCNRYVNGHCSTRRCLVRGGYCGTGPVDHSIATCEEHETILALASRAPEAAKLEEMREALARDVAEIVCRDVAELPDRTSPDDWPEAMLVTGDELQLIVAREMAEALSEIHINFLTDIAALTGAKP